MTYYLAWVSLRQYACAIGQSIYQVHQVPWVDYLRQKLMNPFILVLLPSA